MVIRLTRYEQQSGCKCISCKHQDKSSSIRGGCLCNSGHGYWHSDMERTRDERCPKTHDFTCGVVLYCKYYIRKE